MKKLFIISLAVLSVFAAVGCSTNNHFAEPTSEPTQEVPATAAEADAPTAEPTSIPTEQADDIDPELIEAAWLIAEKLGQVHEQQFDKAGAEAALLYADTWEVHFPSVTYPDEMLFVTVKKVGEGGYSAAAESVCLKPAEGAADEVTARIGAGAVTETLEKFGSAAITVTADEIRASGCGDDIRTDGYKAAAASIYGDKLAEYYRTMLTEDSPFCCYDVRFAATEADTIGQDQYIVVIAFRVRDILPFSYLFSYVPYYCDGSLYPEHEGWMIGWTLVDIDLDADGGFTANAVLNGAG